MFPQNYSGIVNHHANFKELVYNALSDSGPGIYIVCYEIPCSIVPLFDPPSSSRCMLKGGGGCECR